MSREGKLAKNTLIIAFGTFLPKLASFITLPILTGELTKAEYGTYDLITVLVSLLLPAATLQIQSAAFRFLIEVRSDESEIKSIVSSIVAFILPTSIIPLIVLYFILYNQSILVRVFICLYFFADIIVNAARQICRGLSKNLDYSISAIISACGKTVFAIICVYLLKMGLAGTVISLFISSTISFLYLFFKVKLYKYISPNYFSYIKLKEMLKYSWPMVPNSMSGWVMRVSDRFVVTAFMGLGANAVYSVANKIPSLLTLALTTFSMAWQENATIVAKDSDSAEYYSAMYRTLFHIIAGFFGVLIALTPMLFRVLIKGDYDDAYDQMPILFMAMIFYSMSSYIGGIYMAYKDSKSVGWTTIAAATSNIIIDLASIKWIGLYAASLSTLISYVFLLVFRLKDIRRYVVLKINHVKLTGIVFVLTIECVLYYIKSWYCNIVNLIIGLIILVVLNKNLINAIIKRCIKMVHKHN